MNPFNPRNLNILSLNDAQIYVAVQHWPLQQQLKQQTNKQTNLNIFILNDAQLFIAVQHGHLASQESAPRCHR